MFKRKSFRLFGPRFSVIPRIIFFSCKPFSKVKWWGCNDGRGRQCFFACYDWISSTKKKEWTLRFASGSCEESVWLETHTGCSGVAAGRGTQSSWTLQRKTKKAGGADVHAEAAEELFSHWLLHVYGVVWEGKKKSVFFFLLEARKISLSPFSFR